MNVATISSEDSRSEKTIIVEPNANKCRMNQLQEILSVSQSLLVIGFQNDFIFSSYFYCCS